MTTKIGFGCYAIMFVKVILYNSLSSELKNTVSVKVFKRHVEIVYMYVYVLVVYILNYYYYYYYMKCAVLLR